MKKKKKKTQRKASGQRPQALKAKSEWAKLVLLLVILMVALAIAGRGCRHIFAENEVMESGGVLPLRHSITPLPHQTGVDAPVARSLMKMRAPGVTRASLEKLCLS